MIMGGEHYWFAYFDFDFSPRCEVPAFDLIQSFNLHRQNWNAQARGEQSDAAAKSVHLAIRGARAFWKNQHAVAAVGKIAGEGKALAKSGALRQREDVEQSDHQRVTEALQPAAQK